jgi:hypothetical protein
MKKELLLIAAAATMLTACVNTEDFREISEAESAIDFSTFTTKQTKAENSNAEAVNNLEGYNTTFKVWGSKYVVRNSTSTEERVFGVDGTGDIVSWDNNNTTSTKWSYSPVRFWDKSATSYSFYAAAPSGKSWVWNNDTKKLSLADFIISGYNSVTGTPATEVDAAKVLTSALDTEDLMISTDLTGYNTYTSAAVNLHFNHILSRLNIGVRKAAILDEFDVKLNAIKVYNMVNKGSFNENTVLTPDDPNDNEAELLAAGTTKRWTLSAVATDKFTTPMSYVKDGGLEVSSTASDANTKYQYVYEGLVIPQGVAYNPTVEVNDYTANQDPEEFKLDGSNAGASSNPYIFIDYEIWTKAVAAVNYTKETAYDYNIDNNLYNDGFVEEGDDDGSGGTYTKETAYDYNTSLAKDGAAVEGAVKTPAKATAKMDGYQYYYNLADVFNDDAATAVDFCEGWQNTLKITLSPTAIIFDADVYRWAPDKEISVDITASE